MKYMLTL